MEDRNGADQAPQPAPKRTSSDAMVLMDNGVSQDLDRHQQQHPDKIDVNELQKSPPIPVVNHHDQPVPDSSTVLEDVSSSSQIKPTRPTFSSKDPDGNSAYLIPLQSLSPDSSPIQPNNIHRASVSNMPHISQIHKHHTPKRTSLPDLSPMASKPKKGSEEVLNQMDQRVRRGAKSATMGNPTSSSRDLVSVRFSTDLSNSQLNNSMSNWALNDLVRRRASEKPSEPILSALQQEAEEVQNTINVTFANRKIYTRTNQIQSFNMVRAAYRVQRESQRQDPNKSSALVTFLHLLIDVRFHYSLLVDFIKSTGRVVVFMILDLAADIIFCIMYIFEMQWNVTHFYDDIVKEKEPRWLWTSRPGANFVICVCLSIFSLLSLATRTALADNKLKAFFSPSLALGSW
jgi:hypothetical protein